jgi:hypothetical protein
MSVDYVNSIRFQTNPNSYHLITDRNLDDNDEGMTIELYQIENGVHICRNQLTFDKEQFKALKLSLYKFNSKD